MTSLVTGLMVVAAWLWVAHFRGSSESTDNAYVGGHQFQIAPQLPGRVVAVHAADMQAVQAGQLLLELDATDARIALQRAEAGLAQSVRQVRQWQSSAGTSEALIATRSAEITQISAELARRESLLAQKLITSESVEQLRSKLLIAQSQRLAAAKQAEADRARVDDLPISRHPSVQEARAAYIQAWVDLQRTKVVAPVAGTITQRTVHPGHQVASGQSLMRLIPTADIWVDANFKESQLRDLRIGQPATITTALYGDDVPLRGTVAGVSPGTGSVFALLPPQNAAGNWVKVVQRVPVRIVLDPAVIARYPLQIGLSAAVTVDTRDRQGPKLAEQPPAAATNTAVSGPGPAEDQAAADRADDIIAQNSAHRPRARRE